MFSVDETGEPGNSPTMIEGDTRSALTMHPPRDQIRIGQKSAGTSVTEVRIVEAAAQLFAQNGFKGTTTRDIAQLADLNEATLFRYFPRKPDLFWAAVESHMARVKLARDTQTRLASDDVPTVVVPLLVAFLLDSFHHQPQLRRLLHVAAFELPQSGKMIREHLGPIFDMVCAYFKRCAEKGTVAKVEPSLATLGLLGAVTAHQGLCLLFTGKEAPYANHQQALSAYVVLWLNGLLPAKDPATATVAVTSGAL
jgi:AcrR family transcriptional regulator